MKTLSKCACHALRVGQSTNSCKQSLLASSIAKFADFSLCFTDNIIRPNHRIGICICPIGGLIGMLALNGIFVLVTQHGLEYPNFYTRLYALLEPDAFQVCRE